MKGHTFLENDRDFSLIEKRKRTAEVLLPDNWTQVVREANFKKPFIATEVEQCDMKDCQSIVKIRPKKKRSKREKSELTAHGIHQDVFLNIFSTTVVVH